MRVPLLVLLAALGCSRASARVAAPSGRAGELEVARGAFERRVLLSGEIDAVASAELRVPRIPMGRVTIRWLASDGAAVKVGDKLAELDNASFVAQVRERALSVSQSETELRRQEWQNQLDESDRTLEVSRKRTALRRAELDADVPPGILPARDFLEKQLAVRRAKADLERAEETLASQRRTAEVDLRLRRIAVEKVRRELALAQQMIEALTLRAPAAGTVLIGDHWEGRKLQVADEIPVGHVIARLPDLGQIRVKAWLSDVDDGRISAGMPAEVVLDAFPDQVLTGRVLEIAAVAREASDRSLRRVFQVNVAIDGGKQADPRPGMSARVEVIAARQPDVLLVPRQALAVEGATGRVRRVNGAGQQVTLGPCNAQACVVSAGLEPGARLRGAP
jgi:HlyD family secretion protein